MQLYDWTGWYSGWGWFLWYSVFLLFIFSFGNWGYTYRAHRRFEDWYSKKSALDILNERYARGEIKQDDYLKMKSHISPDIQFTSPEMRKAGAEEKNISNGTQTKKPSSQSA